MPRVCVAHRSIRPCTHASRRVDLFRLRDQPPSAHARQRRRTRPAASVQIQQREPSGKRMQTHLTRHAACDGHRNGHLFIVRRAVHAPYSPRRLCSHPPTRSGRSLLLGPRRSRASPRRTFHINVPAQTFSKSGGAKTDAPKCNSNFCIHASRSSSVGRARARRRTSPNTSTDGGGGAGRRGQGCAALATGHKRLTSVFWTGSLMSSFRPTYSHGS